jgi:hypothetical protein
MAAYTSARSTRALKRLGPAGCNRPNEDERCDGCNAIHEGSPTHGNLSTNSSLVIFSPCALQNSVTTWLSFRSVIGSAHWMEWWSVCSWRSTRFGGSGVPTATSHERQGKVLKGLPSGIR